MAHSLPGLSLALLLALSACSSSSGSGAPGGSGGGPGAGTTGAYVAFAAALGAGQPLSLWLVDLDGSNLRDFGPVSSGFDLTGQTGSLQASSDGAYVAIQTRLGTTASTQILDVANGLMSSVTNVPMARVNQGRFVWSPDSQRLAILHYSSAFGGSSEAWIHAPATGQTQSIPTALADPGAPLLWSSDGMALAVRSFASNPFLTALEVFNSDGALLGSVLPAGADYDSSGGSFSSTRLAFAPDFIDGNGTSLERPLLQYDVAANTTTTVGGAGRFVYEHEYSPDGNWLAYTDRSLSTIFETAYIVDASAGGAPLAFSPGTTDGLVRELVWSPTSDRVMIEFVPDSGSTLPTQLILSDTSGATQIVDLQDPSGSPGSLGAFAWSPDGSHCALTVFPSSTLYVMDVAAGTPPQPVPAAGGNSMAIDLRWTPDSGHLLWSAFPFQGSDLMALELGDPNGPFLLGEDIDHIFGNADGPILVTADSSAVVWVERPLGLDRRVVRWTNIADPSDTRNLTSTAGVLDFDRVLQLTLR